MNFVNNRLTTPLDILKNNSALPAETGSDGVVNRLQQDFPVASGDLMLQLMENLDDTNNKPASAIVMQALKEAGLPSTRDNQMLVTLLLANDMPINKEMLRELVQEQKAYPSSSFEALVIMHKSDIPVNTESVATISEVLDNMQIFSRDIESVAGTVEQLLSDSSAPAELQSAVREAVYETFALSSAAQTAVGASANSNVTALVGAAVNQVPAEAVPIKQEQAGYRIVVEATAATLPDEPETEAGGETLSGEFTAKEGGQDLEDGSPHTSTDSHAVPVSADSSAIRTAAETANAFIDRDSFESSSIRTDSDAYREAALAASEQTSEPSSAENPVSAPVPSSEPIIHADVEALRDKIFNASPNEIGNMIRHLLSADVSDISKESVRKLYETSQLLFDKVKDAVKEHEEGQPLGKTVKGASDDLRLLNSLNRMYPQIELPLKFDNPAASGSLYVYSKRNKGKNKTDSCSALLHLTMPALGPVDIKLSLSGKRLNMNFYSDDMARAYLKSDIASLESGISQLDLIVNTLFSGREALKQTSKNDTVKSDQMVRIDTANTRLGFDIRA